ncbi:hypothetical protein L6452_18378 [Arctium lappa]|uniref:Uncharacterized protein n=1 Tax=Arctium lappa TaxID=4217 RepID=A0ACB9C663_ARCLA|nr:hypothetical protein L6452_18378 [Arctium lappa]
MEKASGSGTQPEGQGKSQEQSMDLVLYDIPTVEKPEEQDEGSLIDPKNWALIVDPYSFSDPTEEHANTERALVFLQAEIDEIIDSEFLAQDYQPDVQPSVEIPLLTYTADHHDLPHTYTPVRSPPASPGLRTESTPPAKPSKWEKDRIKVPFMEESQKKIFAHWIRKYDEVVVHVIREDGEKWYFSEDDFPRLEPRDLLFMLRDLKTRTIRPREVTNALNTLKRYMKCAIKLASNEPAFTVLKFPELGMTYANNKGNMCFIRFSQMARFCDGTLMMLKDKLNRAFDKYEKGVQPLDPKYKELVRQALVLLKTGWSTEHKFATSNSILGFERFMFQTGVTSKFYLKAEIVRVFYLLIEFIVSKNRIRRVQRIRTKDIFEEVKNSQRKFQGRNSHKGLYENLIIHTLLSAKSSEFAHQVYTKSIEFVSFIVSFYANYIKMLYIDKKGNIVLTKRDCALAYMPEIPAMEAEIKDLKIQNASLHEQINRLKHNKDFTSDAPRTSNYLLYAERDKLKDKVFSLEVEINMLKEKAIKEKKISTDQDEVKKIEKKRKEIERDNVELKKKISELEDQVNKQKKDKVDFERERKEFAKKFSEFSRKAFEEKKVVDLKYVKLSQQVSDFEKVIIMERDKFDKEKKLAEQKCVKKDFGEEKKAFEDEIKELNGKLSELSTKIQKEKNAKDELHKKFDKLSKERNCLSTKIKELVEIMFKVKLTESKTPESIAQSARYDLAASECHIQRNKTQQKMTWRKKDEKDKENWFWRVKGSSNEEKEQKSFVHTPIAKKNNAPKGKTFGKPDLVYTVNQLIRLAQKKINYSYCGANDFVSKTYMSYWYGSYYISPTKTATNKSGPKYQWVPKAESVL